MVYEVGSTKKEAVITLNGKEYKTTESFRISSFLNARRIVTETNDYKFAFKQMILDKFSEEIVVAEVEQFKDDDYERVIHLFFSDDELLALYNKYPHDDMFKDFFDAFNEFSVTKFSKALEVSIPKISQVFSDIGKRTTEILSKALLSVSEKLTSVVNEFRFDDGCDMVLALKKYAFYGWTIWEDASVSLFLTEPENLENADNNCMSYFTDEEMTKIYEKIRHNPDIINAYFEEAIKLFNDGYYLSCSMNLVACMDKVLSTNIVDEKQTYSRQIGKKAVKKIKKVLIKDKEADINYLFYLYSLIEYLGLLFESGDDFINEPEGINRNFLLHGWQTVEVTRIDCIKLFNTLRNLVGSIHELKALYDATK